MLMFAKPPAEQTGKPAKGLGLRVRSWGGFDGLGQRWNFQRAIEIRRFIVAEEQHDRNSQCLGDTGNLAVRDGATLGFDVRNHAAGDFYSHCLKRAGEGVLRPTPLVAIKQNSWAGQIFRFHF